MENAEPTTALVQVAPHNEEAVILLLNEVQAIATRADAFIVDSQSSCGLATNELSIIASLKKRVGEKRKEYLDPLLDHVEAIRLAFKLLSDPIEYANMVLREKVLVFQSEQERKAREAEAIEREKRELAEREAKLKGEKAPVLPPVATTYVNTSTYADLGDTSITKLWKWEIEDFALVPDIYKKPNNGTISDAVKSSKGSISIPGIRIFQEGTLRVEAKR